MYPVGSILRHYPSTPLPAAVEANEKLKAMPLPANWWHEERTTREQRGWLTNQSKCDHYSAVVIKNGILQVKPTNQMFSSVEEWCTAMHEPPTTTDTLLDHAKVIKELERKKHNLSRSLRIQQNKILTAQQHLLWIHNNLERIKDKIEYHTCHL